MITGLLKRRKVAKVRKYLEIFPVVALLGLRQVGKTTLAKNLLDDKNVHYLDLQDSDVRERLAYPQNYLADHADQLVVLDEVQRVPGLFADLRGIIDRGREEGKVNGRFLILGSVASGLLQQASETLTGRIAYLELDPIDVLELPLTTLFGELWMWGGLPDSLFAKDDAVRKTILNNYSRNLSERDYQQFESRLPVSTFKKMLRMLANRQGQQHNAATLATNLAIDGKTVARHVGILEDMLLLRRLEPWASNIRKRLVKTPKLYYRDSGLLHALLQIPDKESLLAHPVVGASWEGFAIENILRVVPEGTLSSYYCTADGAEVDLVLEHPSWGLWMIEVKFGTKPKLSRSFAEGRKVLKANRCSVVYSGTERYYYTATKEIEVVGLTHLCQELAAVDQ